LVADVERDLTIRSAHLPEELLFEFPAGRCVIKATEATLEGDEFPVEKSLFVSAAPGFAAGRTWVVASLVLPSTSPTYSA
jgi:hypothetical protein